MKKLYLHDRHLELGASFGEEYECQIPFNYGDESREYKTVRENGGIIDLSLRGKLRISGKEHLKFLQGMLSNDVVELESGKGVYATLLTVKGRVVSDMRVYKSEDSIYLDLEPGMNLTVSELLKKYRLSYKADIEDLTDQFGLISVQGPKSNEIISKFFAVNVDDLEEYDHITTNMGGKDIYLVRYDRTSLSGWDIFSDESGLRALWDSLLVTGHELGIGPFGHKTLETLRVEAGIPRYGVDIDETTIPIEAGLWSALNFEKGCYVGQEVVARIKWRGHVNRHLMGFITQGDELPGKDDEIYSDDKKIGRITSSVFSPTIDKPVALGYIRREFKEPGTRVLLKTSKSGPIEAVVSDLPFPSPYSPKK